MKKQTAQILEVDINSPVRLLWRGIPQPGYGGITLKNRIETVKKEISCFNSKVEDYKFFTHAGGYDCTAQAIKAINL